MGEGEAQTSTHYYTLLPHTYVGLHLHNPNHTDRHTWLHVTPSYWWYCIFPTLSTFNYGWGRNTNEHTWLHTKTPLHCRTVPPSLVTQNINKSSLHWWYCTHLAPPKLWLREKHKWARMIVLLLPYVEGLYLPSPNQWVYDRAHIIARFSLTC